mgnify:CR=1 FL=1
MSKDRFTICHEKAAQESSGYDLKFYTVFGQHSYIDDEGFPRLTDDKIGKALAKGGTIGGGFIKYGEIMSKIDSIDPAKAGQIKQDLAIAQKEIELLKVQMKELRASSSNPLAR